LIFRFSGFIKKIYRNCISLSILEMVPSYYYFIATELGGQAWGGGLIREKSIFLPTSKPNNLFVYNAGGRLDIYDRAWWAGHGYQKRE
jgi:hypothetical protein